MKLFHKKHHKHHGTSKIKTKTSNPKKHHKHHKNKNKPFKSVGKFFNKSGKEILHDAKGITKGIKDFGDRLTSPTTMVLVAAVVVGGVVFVYYVNKK